LRLPPGLGWAFWLALLLTGLVELALHSESVMFRYRAVFAQGRAYDKLFEVERRPPQILFIGNSRTDNGIDPRAVEWVWPGHVLRGFNLGLPGANAIVYHGEIRRLDERGLLGKAAIQTVVLGLDESALQEDNSLGYVSFLADRRALWDAARYRDWLEAICGCGRTVATFASCANRTRRCDSSRPVCARSIRSEGQQRPIRAIERVSARPRMRVRWRSRNVRPCIPRHRPSNAFYGRRSISCSRAAYGCSSPCRPCVTACPPLSIPAPRPPPIGHC